jgi:hypothetical protein
VKNPSAWQYAFREAGLDRAEHLREDAEALARHWPAARVVVIEDGLAER